MRVACRPLSIVAPARHNDAIVPAVAPRSRHQGFPLMLLRRLIPAAVVAGLFVALAAPSPAQKPFDDPILERMRKDIFFLASPECEGRGDRHQGHREGRRLRRRRVQGGRAQAGDEGRLLLPAVHHHRRPRSSASRRRSTLTGPDEREARTEARHRLQPRWASARQRRPAGGLVFVGYGITAPDLKYDDYAGSTWRARSS